jgi:hypothetical protein
MAYNPQIYIPQNYQQYYPQYQQQQVQQPQTKLVEIIPVDTVKEAEDCPMAAGSSGFFFARDDSFNAVKSVGLNGQVTFVVYDKRPPAPPAPQFDPAAYVRRDEIEALIAAVVARRNEE